MADVSITDHAKYRLLERCIDVHEAKMVAKNGEIKSVQSNGSIVKRGKVSNGNILNVVTVRSGSRIIVKTAFYEN
jgi:hypothetical protein